MFYSEGSANRQLHSFTLKKTERLSLDEYLNRTLAEFRNRAQRGGDSSHVRERLSLLLALDQRDLALKSVKEFAGNFQNDWLDQLILCITSSRTNPRARENLEGWARKQNNFTGWIFAAYAFERIGDSEGMERCVTNALAHPPDDPDWVQWHARVRAMPICVALHNSQKYDTTIKLANALLEYKDAGTNLQAELEKVQSSAQAAIANGTPADPLSFADLMHPFEGIDLARLQDTPTTTPSNP